MSERSPMERTGISSQHPSTSTGLSSGYPAISRASHSGAQTSEAPLTASRDDSDAGPLSWPCSPEQRRLWMLDRIDPGSPALNISACWRLEHAVPISLLEAAFTLIIERHQALRTCIAEEDGVPVQKVTPPTLFHLPDIDLSALTRCEAQAECERITMLEVQAPFDLSLAPLIRVTHLRVQADLSLILFTAHQLVCDARSIELLAQELMTACTALLQARRPQFAHLQICYGTHAERLCRAGADRERGDEAYWLRTLAGLPYFELRSDHPRPAVQTRNADRVSIRVDRQTVATLTDQIWDADCDASSIALGGLLVLLHRYSDETDIAIGVEWSGREQAELQPMLGRFAGMRVVRSDLDGDPSFADLIDRLSTQAAASSAHRALSLERIIELLQPRRDRSRSALFSVCFSSAPAPLTRRAIGDLQLVEQPGKPGGVLYDLHFGMAEAADGWRLSCDFNTDLFDRVTVADLLRHWCNLLQSAAREPNLAISLMPMMDQAEQDALLAEADAGATAYPRNRCTPQLIESQALATPDAIAICCGERSLSYRELNLASNRLAHVLRERGVCRGARVGVCLDRSIDLVIALLAVLKAGGAYVPLDPAYPALRLQQIIEDAGPMAVLTRRVLRGRLPVNDAAVILIDTDAAVFSAGDDSMPHPAGDPEDLAYVIFTSGSTGRPKGVQIQHRALTNLLWAMRDRPGLTAEDRLVAVTTVAFDIATLELFLPLIVGATLIIAREEEAMDGVALLRLLQRHRASVMQATPVTWQILLAAGWQGGPQLKMLCGGEPMPRPLADQLLAQGGELWNLYGPTETTIWSSALRVRPGAGAVPVGPPIANTQFYVLDRRARLAPRGAAGELYIGGEGVALGYLNRPELTRERFVPDRYGRSAGARLYRTGDCVRQRRDGGFEFLGRNDHQIKLRGFRIELGDVESALRAATSLVECVAVVSPDASGEPALIAYLVREIGSDQSKELFITQLRTRLGQLLPAYMVPTLLIVLERLPRMPNGKIDRSALPPPQAMAPVADVAVQALSGTLKRLAAVWSGVLGVAVVDANANFFEIGGHSLLAVRLIARIEVEFGRRLSLVALFEHPCLCQQLRLLEDDVMQDYDFRQVVKLQPNGTRPPLIAINNTGIYYALSKHLGSDQPFVSLQLFDPALPHVQLPSSLEDIAAGYVQLIRRVQSDGPYSLLGWCVAGTLAFEVARQLSATGHAVAQLSLFDTLAPGHMRRLPWYRFLLADYSYRWKLIAADWNQSTKRRHPLRSFVRNRLTIQLLLRWLSWRPFQRRATPAAAEPILSPEQYDQWLLQYLQSASDRYDPGLYEGAVTLYRSSAEPAGRFIDPLMGWGTFVKAGVEVVVIDGDHFSIFQEPQVSRLAEHIAAGMNASLRAGDGKVL